MIRNEEHIQHGHGHESSTALIYQRICITDFADEELRIVKKKKRTTCCFRLAFFTCSLKTFLLANVLVLLKNTFPCLRIIILTKTQ